MEININIRMSPEELAILKGVESHNGNGNLGIEKVEEINRPELEHSNNGNGNGYGINYSDYRDEFVEWLYNNINDDSAKQYSKDLDTTIYGVPIERPNQLSKMFSGELPLALARGFGGSLKPKWFPYPLWHVHSATIEYP